MFPKTAKMNKKGDRKIEPIEGKMVRFRKSVIKATRSIATRSSRRARKKYTHTHTNIELC